MNTTISLIATTPGTSKLKSDSTTSALSITGSESLETQDNAKSLAGNIAGFNLKANSVLDAKANAIKSKDTLDTDSKFSALLQQHYPMKEGAEQGQRPGRAEKSIGIELPTPAKDADADSAALVLNTKPIADPQLLNTHAPTTDELLRPASPSSIFTISQTDVETVDIKITKDPTLSLTTKVDSDPEILVKTGLNLSVPTEDHAGSVAKQKLEIPANPLLDSQLDTRLNKDAETETTRPLSGNHAELKTIVGKEMQQGQSLTQESADIQATELKVTSATNAPTNNTQTPDKQFLRDPVAPITTVSTKAEALPSAGQTAIADSNVEAVPIEPGRPNTSRMDQSLAQWLSRTDPNGNEKSPTANAATTTRFENTAAIKNELANASGIEVGKNLPPAGKELPIFNPQAILAVQGSPARSAGNSLRPGLLRGVLGAQKDSSKDSSDITASSLNSRSVLTPANASPGELFNRIMQQSSLLATASEGSLNSLRTDTADTQAGLTYSSLQVGAERPASSRTFTMPGLETASNFSFELKTDSPDWNTQLGSRIRWMSNMNISSAELKLHPAELGKVEITITTEDDQTKVSFVTHTAAAKEMIETSMPRLRDLLNSSGLQLQQGDVAHRNLAGNDSDKERSYSPNNAPSEPGFKEELPIRAVIKSSHQIDHYV